MTHRIQKIRPLENFELLATFQNGIEKRYDVKQLYKAFPQLREVEKVSELFEQVQVDAGGYGISWNDNLDIDAEEIWENGIKVGIDSKMEVVYLLAADLIETREQMGMTQMQLAEETGIYQADISKIERGLANPSLSTLQRLADGMNAELKIEFIKKSL